MDKKDLLEIIERAASYLKEHDSYLLFYDLSEECIAHRFAVYLEQGIRAHRDWPQKRYCVDVEYNRFGIEPKRIPRRFGGEPGKTNPVPDIIVHQRGASPDRINLLAVEVKKTSNMMIGDSAEYARWKLEAYKYFFGYMCSLLICFKVKERFSAIRRGQSDAKCYEEFEFFEGVVRQPDFEEL